MCDCIGDEPVGSVALIRADDTVWTNIASSACFADCFVNEWGAAFGIVRWEWQYPPENYPPALTTPVPGETS